MGRFDRIYTDEQKQELCRMVRKDGWSVKQAAEKIGMGMETARLTVQADYFQNPNDLDPTNPIGHMASRLIDAVNKELTQLERAANPHNKLPFDLNRAAALAKLLLDLDKLRKANMPVSEPEKPESPLAGLVTPSNGKG